MIGLHIELAHPNRRVAMSIGRGTAFSSSAKTDLECEEKFPLILKRSLVKSQPWGKVIKSLLINDFNKLKLKTKSFFNLIVF